MKGLVIGIFILLLLAAANQGNDPFGWEAQARIEQQTQLQVATIQANAELESIRLQHAADMERAQVRAALIAGFLQALPVTIGVLCAAALLGMLLHYRWKTQLAMVANQMSSPPTGYLEASQRMLPLPASPILEISARDLQKLQHQAQATGHRLDVVTKGNHQAALLIDNVTGEVRGERGFVVKEAVVG